MNAALVVDRFDGLGGGLERWTVRLAAHLMEAGHQVQVVAFHDAGHTLPIPVHILPWHGSALVRGRRIAACLATLDAQVVHDSGSGWSGHVFHPQTGSHLASLDREIASHSAARRLKAALSPRTRVRRWRMARAEARQAATARRIVAVSRSIAADLVHRHRVDPASVVVIPNGADTARFAPGRLAPLRPAARAALGLADETLFLGSAYNLRLKGMDTAIRALAAVPGAHLAIAGGTPDAWWRGLAAQAGVAGRVHFLGPLDDMAPAFAAADALLHPTRWDACSLSTIEAAAAALPVVTTAINGAAELIDPGRTGIVLPDPADIPALAATMRTLLDPALRARIGAAAHAASGVHDIAINLRAVEEVLIEAALTPRAGTPPAAAPAAAPGIPPG